MTQDIAYFHKFVGFARFIRERGVKNKLIKNFYQNNRLVDNTYSIKENYRRYLRSKFNYSFIDYTIDWSRANEGFEFWSNLSRELEYLTACRCTTI